MPRPGLLLGAGLMWLLAPAAAASPQDLNRLADGGFESGPVSLSLGAVSRYPLVVGGWASRGSPPPEVVHDPGTAYEGSASLHLRSGVPEAVHLIQDFPTSTVGYRLQLAFMPERGTQAVTLLAGWDRTFPPAPAAVRVELGPAGLVVETPAGRWRLDHPIEPHRWHSLEVVADPRLDLQTLALDGRRLLALPGLPARPPRTLVIGEADSGRPSSYRYDALALVQLAEEEVAILLHRAPAAVPPSVLPWLVPRLEAAAEALRRGAPYMALPEVRAARRVLDPPAGGPLPEAADALGGFRRSLEALVALLEDG